MTTAYDAPIPYDSVIAYDGGTSVVTSEQLPTWQLEVENPFTGEKSPLPEANIDQMSFESSAVSAISFAVANTSVGASLCGDLAIVSLKANGQDVKDGRWLLRGQGWDAGRTAQVKKFTGRSLLWDRLEHTVVQPGTRKLYTTKTPGYILNDLFAEAQLRDVGFFDTFTWTFDQGKDSNGNAWPVTLGSIEYLPSAKYSDIVSNLVDKGVIEISLMGNEIRATVPNTDGVVTPALLVVGEDVTDAPQQSSADNLVSDVVVLGDDGVAVVRSNTETRATYWREEAGISQGGTKDEGTLSIFGDVALSTGNAPRIQRTYALVVTQERTFLPLRDYAVTDWVRVQHGDGTPALSVRVKQIVLKQDPTGWSGTLVLNDKFLENELRLTKKVDGIIGGATITGSAQTSTPDDLKDTGIPNKPSGLTLAFNTYVDNGGQTKNTLIGSWNAVTTNTDGSVANDIDQYLFQWKYSNEADNTVKSVWTSNTFASVSPLDPGRSVTAWVSVYDQNRNWSGYSASVSGDSALDTTPPPAPSGPLLLSLLRTLVVEWNGLTAAGGQMPADLHHVEVYTSQINNFDVYMDGDLRGTLSAPGQLTFSMYADSVGSTVYVKMVAVDNSGNRSVASSQNFTTVNGVSGADINANSITTNNIAAGAITSQLINAGAINADKISLGQTVNLVQDPSFNNSDWRAKRLTTAWSDKPSRWFFNNWSGISRNGYYLQALSTPDGINGGRMYICDWIYVQLGESYYAGIYLRNGEFTPNAEATARLGVEVTKADGTILSDGISYVPTGTWTKQGYRFTIIDQSWVKLRFFVRVDNITAGDIAFDDFEVRGSVGTTEYTGSRGLLDAMGLFAWDSTDTQTVAINFLTGDATLRGTIKSGFTGKRTEINPGSTYLPEIRFYPQTGDLFAYINASDNGSYPFIGVNAPDTGTSSNAMVLFDTLWQLGEIRKSDGTIVGAGVMGSNAGTAGYVTLYGKNGGGSSGYHTFASYVFKNLVPSAASSYSVILTKPTAAVSGQWILLYSVRRNAGQRFTHQVTATTSTTESVSFYTAVAGGVDNPAFTSTPFEVRHMWVRSDGDA